DGQFDKAIQTLQHSQTVDSTYERTPFIKGQLLQDRTSAVKNAIMSGTALPTGGETDYNKLLLETGQAYSESIADNPSFFVDNGMQGIVDYMLTATQPFTDSVHHNMFDTSPSRNVLTDTITAAYQQLVQPKEKALADYLRGRRAYTGKDDLVPADVLTALWQKSDWAGKRPAGNTTEWLDDSMLSLAHNAVVPYAALGYIRFKLYDPAQNVLTPEREQLLADATADYDRAVVIDPSNYFNQKNLGSLHIERGQQLHTAKECDQSKQTYQVGLQHLQAALAIVQAQPDVNQDQTKSQDLKTIQDNVNQAQTLL